MSVHIICFLLRNKKKKSYLYYPQYPHVSGAMQPLTLKALITTAADDIHKYFFHCFSEKIRLEVSSESSARQRIHMKNQALFSSKDKSKKLKCHLLQFLFGTLRVKVPQRIKSKTVQIQVRWLRISYLVWICAACKFIFGILNFCLTFLKHFV